MQSIRRTNGLLRVILISHIMANWTIFGISDIPIMQLPVQGAWYPQCCTSLSALSTSWHVWSPRFCTLCTPASWNPWAMQHCVGCPVLMGSPCLRGLNPHVGQLYMGWLACGLKNTGQGEPADSPVQKVNTYLGCLACWFKLPGWEKSILSPA